MAAKKSREFATTGEGIGLALGHDVHHARTTAVWFGAAEALHVDVFAGDRSHHLWPGHEDSSVGGEDHHVGERRPVGRAARGRAEHDRDLRNAPGGQRHGGEDAAHGIEAGHALAQARPAAVPEADDG